MLASFRRCWGLAPFLSRAISGGFEGIFFDGAILSLFFRIDLGRFVPTRCIAVQAMSLHFFVSIENVVVDFAKYLARLLKRSHDMLKNAAGDLDTLKCEQLRNQSKLLAVQDELSNNIRKIKI